MIISKRGKLSRLMKEDSLSVRLPKEWSAGGTGAHHQNKRSSLCNQPFHFWVIS